MSEEAPKLRLKPRLAADTPAAPGAPAATPEPAHASPSPAAAAPVPAAEAPTPPPVPAEPAAKPKVSFRPGVEPATPPPTPAAPAAIAPFPAVAAVAPPVAVAAPSGAVPPLLSAAPPAAADPSDPAVAASTAPVSSESARRVKMVALGIGVAGLLFAAVGYIAYPAWREAAATAKDGNEKEPRTVTAPTKAPTAAEPPPAPSLATKPAVPAPVVATPPPVATPPAAASTPPVAEGPPEPSNAFKDWVTNLKITATRAGANPRLFVGGKSFNRGDVVNADLGITFDAYDDERHMIRFKDATGATFERRR